MESLPRRSRPSDNHVVTKPNRTDLLYVTVCVEGRREILANDFMHRLMLDCWSVADQWSVGKYVVMPDHVHFFCTPMTWERDFENRIRYWKRLVTNSAHLGRIWQSGCWDTQIRKHETYEQKWDYTHLNPVRRGLVQKPEDWPYAGEVNLIGWSGE